MQNSKSDYQLNVDSAYLTNIEIEAAKLRAQAFADHASALGTLISKAFKGVFNLFNSFSERSRVLKELYAMDDRTLEDIGLTRGDIEDVVNGTLRSKNAEPVPANIEFFATSNATAVAVDEATTDKVKIAA